MASRMYSLIQPLQPQCIGRSIKLFSARAAMLQEESMQHYIPVKPQAWVTDFQTGRNITIMDLNERVFGRQPRLDIMQRVVVWQRAKIRAGTARVKTRKEVRGGGRKPWPQKGLGKARQGSTRAPHWKGGGVVHGPRGPVSYDYTLPKKIRALGLCSALSIKYAQGDMVIVDSLAMPSRKTKALVSLMEDHKWGSSVLMVDGGDKVDLNLAYASQNLQDIDVLPLIGLNVYSILLRNKLVLSVGAVRLIEERLSKL